MKQLLWIVTLALCTLPVKGQSSGASMSLAPAYIWFTEADARGTFWVRNPGTDPVEILITPNYGMLGVPDGKDQTSIVRGEAGLLGDLTEHMTLFPPRAIIPPGESQLVRFTIRDAASLEQKGWVSLIEFKMSSRSAIREDATPAIASGLRINYSLIAPLVMINGSGTPDLSAQAVGAQDSTLAVMISNASHWPFAGTVEVHSEDGATMYGSAAVTGVYERRRMEIPVKGPLPGRVRLVFNNEAPSIPDEVKQRLGIPPPVTIEI